MEPPYTQRSGVPLQTRPVLSPFNPSALQSLNSILPPKKNGISIELHDHFASKRYRPGSIVQGTVNIKPKKPVHFTTISIRFVCDSSVERPNGNLSFETWHRLLDLEMPIPQDALPESKVLQPNETYTIPFYFVLPDHLGTEACTHNVIWGETRQLHLQLPPSITGWERDAMIPRGARIEYGVIAQVLDSNNPDYAKFESKETIQFLPGFVEHPLSKIPDTNRTYKLKATKQLKTNVFSRSTGQIILSADQPKALVLDTSGKGFHSTAVLSSLYLEPFDGKALPSKCSVSAKIESETWSQDVPMQHYPHMLDTRDAYTSSETFLKKTEIDLTWERNASKQTSTSPQSAETFMSQFEIPLQSFASDKKMFLPTFYSCLVARTYQLHLTINVASVVLKLVLPIQLTMEDQMAATQPDDMDTIFSDQNSSRVSDSLPSYLESERRDSRTS
ncbi:hypothetical protein FSARC_14915 [Fusarium sarcochroum]|uniref:Arrestin-like N-terminal domain-containing protein n=1 Tax=Fusarium sarcochroum TaxID=1208366 RepID=A0A8H4SQ58_9HYPO|nr:hypothetical protein FSARC_14915 [Fusarium sarcochroum]